ncbi:MAG: hypothetical protein JSS66_12525 [Armatimonadetes bacterium]|nr:hypothetical protein [Armatimonadota bacterium]
MNTLTTIGISALTGALAAGAVSMVSYVELQASTPGSQQVGHSNISGYSLASRFGAGVSPTLARVQINETGTAQGVRSITNSGVAVYGQSTATVGLGAGGYFTSASGGGRALVAEQLSTSGSTVGGLFYSRSSTGTACWGKATATTGANSGVFGESPSVDGFGVRATNTSGDGTAISATNVSSSSGRAAIFANDPSTTGAWHRAIHAQGGGDNGDCAFFECLNTGFSYAVKAYTAGSSGRAIDAHATDSSGSNFGVYGESDSGTNGYGVFSNGNTGATGTKSLVIDHPLDPANKILKQYCAEGSEPTMLYSGMVQLNANGQASVSLPDYFDAIAKNPRYTLTAVGAPMPNLYVSGQEVNGVFKISGGKPNGTVSWTVMATRNDPWVRANGAPTVIAKPQAERGHYLTPKLYNQPASKEFGIQPAQRAQRQADERTARP